MGSPPQHLLAARRLSGRPANVPAKMQVTAKRGPGGDPAGTDAGRLAAEAWMLSLQVGSRRPELSSLNLPEANLSRRGPAFASAAISILYRKAAGHYRDRPAPLYPELSPAVRLFFQPPTPHKRARFVFPFGAPELKKAHQSQ